MKTDFNRFVDFLHEMGVDWGHAAFPKDPNDGFPEETYRMLHTNGGAVFLFDKDGNFIGESDHRESLHTPRFVPRSK